MSACATARAPKPCPTLSFSLREGGFYFLTGPSGAGKTSLLKLLYLAQRPSRGLIKLFNEDIVTMPRRRLPGFRRRIGVVFQEFRLVPHLSAFDNVALPLRVAGVEERDLETPVNEMLAWVGLGHRSTARPATLSGGEQQRVAIARAVIARPELLVADEPTGNVDPEMAKRLLHLFDSLNKLGTTVVVATHDLHLISRINRAEMLRLDRGQLLDPTGALRHPPRRPEAVKGGIRKFGAADRRLLPEGRLAGPMPWVIAIMMFLTVLAAAAGPRSRHRGRAASTPISPTRSRSRSSSPIPTFARPRPRPPSRALRRPAGRRECPADRRRRDGGSARAVDRRRRPRGGPADPDHDRRRSRPPRAQDGIEALEGRARQGGAVGADRRQCAMAGAAGQADHRAEMARRGARPADDRRDRRRPWCWRRGLRSTPIATRSKSSI